MSLKLNSSGGGSVTLQEPNTATNGTLTLPAGSGTVAVNGLSSNIVSDTAKASTSGTSVDFTGIPSWVKRITVIFNGVSTNGTSNYQVQIGTSGGVVASGYLGASADGPTLAGTSFTTGFGVRAGSAAVVLHGAMQILNISGDSWTASGNLARSDSAVFISTAGSVTLSGTLDRVRVTTVNGTDTFDAGTINILYE